MVSHLIVKIHLSLNNDDLYDSVQYLHNMYFY
jgi:hypothetical protein